MHQHSFDYLNSINHFVMLCVRFGKALTFADTKVIVGKYCFVRWCTVMLQDEWPPFFPSIALFLQTSCTAIVPHFSCIGTSFVNSKFANTFRPSRFAKHNRC